MSAVPGLSQLYVILLSSMDAILFFLPYRAERARALRDSVTDFLVGGRLRDVFELGSGTFQDLSDLPPCCWNNRRRFSAAFPATAPTTPPTTAPIGPAMLPAAAPTTAPAICFGIAGISMFLDDFEFSSFFGSGLSGIDGGTPLFVRLQQDYDVRPRTAVTKLT